MSDLKLDPQRTAVVVIDLQKGIVQIPRDRHVTETVIANCARLLTRARHAGARAILVHVGGAPDGADRLRPSSPPLQVTSVAVNPATAQVFIGHSQLFTVQVTGTGASSAAASLTKHSASSGSAAE
jgi:nicotinamidase-related amidase